MILHICGMKYWNLKRCSQTFYTYMKTYKCHEEADGKRGFAKIVVFYRDFEVFYNHPILIPYCVDTLMISAAGLVNSGVACRPNTVYRLTPSCQSVAVCRDGLTQVLNCGAGTSYDVYSDRCVPFLRARWYVTLLNYNRSLHFI